MFLSTTWWRTKRPADHPSYLALGFTADCSRAFETRRSYKSPFALSNFQRLLPHYFQPQRRISQTAMNCEDCSSSTSSSSSERLHSIPSSSSCSLMTPSAKRKAGRKKFRETRHPVYRGVRARNGGKWVCEVREPFKKSRIWLGTYPNPEMAARAHDVAAVALRGEAAQLNFPELALALPRAESTSPNAIRQAAYRAAEMLRCEASTSTSSKPPRQLREKDGDAAAVNLRQGAAEWKVFVDEEAEFNMPGFLDSMAQGMLLTPLAMQKGFSWDGFECHVDLSLWND